jgi:hypothetical protein
MSSTKEISLKQKQQLHGAWYDQTIVTPMSSKVTFSDKPPMLDLASHEAGNKQPTENTKNVRDILGCGV